MFSQPDKKKIPILMYHSISQRAAPNYRRFAVPPALFAAHMAYLNRHHYTSITVTQFITMRMAGSFSLPERPVILTFDDGFADLAISRDANSARHCRNYSEYRHGC